MTFFFTILGTRLLYTYMYLSVARLYALLYWLFLFMEKVFLLYLFKSRVWTCSTFFSPFFSRIKLISKFLSQLLRNTIVIIRCCGLVFYLYPFLWHCASVIIRLPPPPTHLFGLFWIKFLYPLEVCLSTHLWSIVWVKNYRTSTSQKNVWDLLNRKWQLMSKYFYELLKSEKYLFGKLGWFYSG